ncbi:MAG: SCO family protein [Pseudomonadota bacterium]
MNRRTVALGLLGAGAVALAAGAVMLSPSGGAMTAAPKNAGVGGPFALTAQDGRIVTDEDLRGRPFAIFFGFTHCPDICPTTLFEMSVAMERLGPDADAMNFVFVTVDPDRDTPERLATYLAHFDERMIGLAGDAEETADIARQYRVIYEKVPTSGDYTMNHTATIFLMDAEGEYAGAISYGESAELQIKKLRRLVGAAGV